MESKKQQKDFTRNDFIEARENKWIITFFAWYSRFLAGRVFHRVYLEKRYEPAPGRSTLFFGNHSSWWDALTPLLLNHFKLRQRPRAIMEWEQVNKYPFFRRIGCFSINRGNPKSALQSLLYGIDWLNQPGNSLFMYPEGKILNPAASSLSYESGTGWMVPRLDNHVDLVPFTQHIHQMHHHKPSLFIRLGKPVDCDKLGTDKNEITQVLRELSQAELSELIEASSSKTPGVPLWF